VTPTSDGTAWVLADTRCASNVYMQTYDFLTGIPPGVLSAEHKPEPSDLEKILLRTRPERLPFVPFPAPTVPIPPSDNMGVNSASGHPRKGPAEQGVSAGEKSNRPSTPSEKGSDELTPEEYYYRIAADTLQFSVTAIAADQARIFEVFDQRRTAEQWKALAGNTFITRFACHDGRELHVKPHGGKPAYHLLMVDADGLNIRAFPQDHASGMPAFIVRFGARWCVEHSYQSLVQWTREFAAWCGCTATAVKLSELHLRCDVPTPFVQRDVKRIRGTGTRNANLDFRQTQGRLTGINNLGGKKPFRFVIYDKREEVRHHGKLLWPVVWSQHHVPDDRPVWRIEARWSRKMLLNLGLDNAADLTDRSVAALWQWFTRRYLYFVSDPSKRTDRTSITRKWSKIQEVLQVTAPLPPIEREEVLPEQLLKQAAGCLASAFARAGIDADSKRAQKVLARVEREAIERFHERYIKSQPTTPINT